VLTHLDRLVERNSILAECVEDIQRAYDLLAETFLNENKLLLCGNGGSAADSEHWAGELLKGFAHPRRLPAHMREGLSDALANGLQWAFPVIPLTGFAAFSTAFSNDVSPSHVFAQLVFALGQRRSSGCPQHIGELPECLFGCPVSARQGTSRVGADG
jgi:D-sedoheptulose 7-phosphate isomerase